MTIAENIRYGEAKATLKQVKEAAEVANAKKFIKKLDSKYKQMVGEKGSTLSGGQRQRIAIARAVIRNPVILITDEATSALDAASEKRVQLALDQVMKGRTAVIVAHRLSTIRNANVIYVFDTGEIREVGTHDELVERKGHYYELVKRQLTAKDVGKISDEKTTKRAKPAGKKSSAKSPLVSDSFSELSWSSEDPPAPKRPTTRVKPPQKVVDDSSSETSSESTEERRPTRKAKKQKDSSESSADDEEDESEEDDDDDDDEEEEDEDEEDSESPSESESETSASGSTEESESSESSS
jgi:ABC-type glutathione transport system ATPase component